MPAGGVIQLCVPRGLGDRHLGWQPALRPQAEAWREAQQDTQANEAWELPL